jgi:hypothetical protein
MLSRNGMAFCDFSRHAMYDESVDAWRCFGLFLRRSQIVSSSQQSGSNHKLRSFRSHDAHLERACLWCTPVVRRDEKSY